MGRQIKAELRKHDVRVSTGVAPSQTSRKPSPSKMVVVWGNCPSRLKPSWRNESADQSKHLSLPGWKEQNRCQALQTRIIRLLPPSGPKRRFCPNTGLEGPVRAQNDGGGGAIFTSLCCSRLINLACSKYRGGGASCGSPSTAPSSAHLTIV